MPNLKIFGSPIHDTSIIFIASATISSILFYQNDSYLDRSEANFTILIGFLSSLTYWFKEYRVKK